MTAYLVAVHILALIGVLAVLGVIGVLIFTAKFSDPGDGTRPASEVVAGHTGNVRLIAPAEYPTGEVIDLRSVKTSPAVDLLGCCCPYHGTVCLGDSCACREHHVPGGIA